MAWPDNWQPRGIPWSHIQAVSASRILMTLPVFAGVQVLGVDEHVCFHQDRHRRGPH